MNEKFAYFWMKFLAIKLELFNLKFIQFIRDSSQIVEDKWT